VAVDPLVLNGGNPWDEILMVGGAILLAWIVVRLTTRGNREGGDGDGGNGGDGNGD
jgi:hypothetical protein